MIEFWAYFLLIGWGLEATFLHINKKPDESANRAARVLVVLPLTGRVLGWW